jgi:hypothetical protein
VAFQATNRLNQIFCLISLRLLRIKKGKPAKKYKKNPYMAVDSGGFSLNSKLMGVLK